MKKFILSFSILGKYLGNKEILKRYLKENNISFKTKTVKEKFDIPDIIDEEIEYDVIVAEIFIKDNEFIVDKIENFSNELAKIVLPETMITVSVFESDNNLDKFLESPPTSEPLIISVVKPDKVRIMRKYSIYLSDPVKNIPKMMKALDEDDILLGVDIKIHTTDELRRIEEGIEYD